MARRKRFCVVVGGGRRARRSFPKKCYATKAQAKRRVRSIRRVARAYPGVSTIFILTDGRL